MWKPGDRLTHRFNPEMGPGQVVEVSGRNVVVRFPESGQTLSLATGSDALVPLVLVPGARARLEGTNETVVPVWVVLDSPLSSVAPSAPPVS